MRRLLAIAAVGAILGCGSMNPETEVVSGWVMPHDARVAFDMATRADAYRTSRVRDGDWPGIDGTTNLAGKTVVNYGPVPQEAVWLDELKQTVRRLDAMGPRPKALCLPDYGVTVRLSGPRPLDLMLCFTCDTLGWAWPGEEMLATKGFDKVRPDFVRLAKKAFPDDAQIKALDE